MWATWRSCSPRRANRANALALLTPVVKAQTVKTGPAYARLMEAQLKAFVTSGQVEPAIASMKSLEDSGGAAGRAQLYFKLGKLLEKELETLKQKRDTRALSRMHQAYKLFLTTLAASKTGQTYDSLQWAGEGLLTLDANEEAEKVFDRVLKEFTQDPEFAQQPGARNKLLRTRVKLAAALRGQGEFDKARTLVDDLLKEYSRFVEPRVREGHASRGRSRGQKGNMVGRSSALGETGKNAGRCSSANSCLLRRLVPRRPGPLQAKRGNKGASNSHGSDAPIPQCRQFRDEGQISMICSSGPNDARGKRPMSIRLRVPGASRAGLVAAFRRDHGSLVRHRLRPMISR